MNLSGRWIVVTFCFLACQFQLLASAKDSKKTLTEFDFIVVGAGAAGAVLARRLSDHESVSVLLLEAGGYPPSISIPYFGMGPFGGEYDWNYVTEPQTEASQALYEKRWVFPRGRGLGGTTIINGMVYTRGSRRDYDTWAELGNDGWAFKDMLPLFKKIEHYNDSFISPEDAEYRGKDGPMSVSRQPFHSSVADAFLEGGKQMGYSVIDFNAAKQTGFSTGNYNLINGERHSTYNAYLEPVLDRPNLHIVTDALVLKVLFDKQKRAVGVTYEKDGTLIEASAIKEVLLSAGATNSPPLLMHSGIGPRDILDKFGIPVVADVKGVGRRLLDHVAAVGMLFTIEKPVGLNKKRDFTMENLVEWEKYRRGPFTVPASIEGIAFINTRFADKNEDNPDLEILLLTDETANCFGDQPKLYKSALGAPDDRDVFTLYPMVQRPKSVGFITINSSNPRDAPLFDPRYLTNEEDVELLLEGIKLALQLVETPAFQHLGAKFHGRALPQCQQHSIGTDTYWRCIIRHLSTGLHHMSGTCKMGPANDPEAVVDPKLRVNGVKNLRVVDASITPTMLTAHMMVPSMMIAEKAAVMILEDWGYKQAAHEEL